MARNVNDIIKKLGPARKQKIDARAAELIKEETTLQEKLSTLPPGRRKKIKTRAAQLIAESEGDETVTEGSGNVFADLGLPDADQELAKAEQKLGRHRRGRKRLSAAKRTR